MVLLLAPVGPFAGAAGRLRVFGCSLMLQSAHQSGPTRGHPLAKVKFRESCLRCWPCSHMFQSAHESGPTRCHALAKVKFRESYSCVGQVLICFNRPTRADLHAVTHWRKLSFGNPVFAVWQKGRRPRCCHLATELLMGEAGTLLAGAWGRAHASGQRVATHAGRRQKEAA